MKEIETLVEEKAKEALDVSRLTREGERTRSGHLGCRGGSKASAPRLSWAVPIRGQPRDLSLPLAARSFLTHPAKSTKSGPCLGNKTPVFS